MEVEQAAADFVHALAEPVAQQRTQDHALGNTTNAAGIDQDQEMVG